MNELELVMGTVQTLAGVGLGQFVSEMRSRRAEGFLRRVAPTDSQLETLLQRVAFE